MYFEVRHFSYRDSSDGILNYTSWDKDKGEPNGGTDENCVAYNRENDKWETMNCTAHFAWICQYGIYKRDEIAQTDNKAIEYIMTAVKLKECLVQIIYCRICFIFSSCLYCMLCKIKFHNLYN